MTAVAAMAYSIEEIPNVHLTDKTQYVSNPDGVLRQTTVDSLNRSIAHIWQSSSAEVVAVVVNSIDGNDIDDYATALFRHWGIGKKDNNNGVLVLVSTEERKAVIRNGYGAEGHSPRHHLRTHNPRQHGAAFPRRRLRRRYAFSGCPHRLPAHHPRCCG